MGLATGHSAWLGEVASMDEFSALDGALDSSSGGSGAAARHVVAPAELDSSRSLSSGGWWEVVEVVGSLPEGGVGTGSASASTASGSTSSTAGVVVVVVVGFLGEVVDLLLGVGRSGEEGGNFVRPVLDNFLQGFIDRPVGYRVFFACTFSPEQCPSDE